MDEVKVTLNARAGSTAKKREAETRAVIQALDIDSPTLIEELSVILIWFCPCQSIEA